MDLRFSLYPTFEAVFLINGRLIEKGEIVFASDEVVFITVLPLDALLLPYTVKLVGAYVKSNLPLTRCYFLEDNKYFLKLLARYNYVYSVPVEDKITPSNRVDSFFDFIKKGQIEKARQSLSLELSQSIDDSSLLGFFDDFVDLVKSDDDDYYLIDKNNCGKLHRFIIKNGVIDNIIEL